MCIRDSIHALQCPARGAIHHPVHRLAGTLALRARDAGGVHQLQWPAWKCGNPQQTMPRGLRPVRRNADLGSHQRIDQGGFADVGAADYGHRAAAVSYTHLDVYKRQGLPVVLVVNQVDKQKDKTTLLPFITKVTEGREFAAVHPLSALKRSGLEQLVATLMDLVPEAEPMYGEDEITDKSQRFLAGELVREQLMRRLGEELPYSTTVEVEDVYKRQQDTFIRAYRAIKNFRGDAQFSTWLHTIAVNTAKNHLAANNRRPPGEDIDVEDAEQFESSLRLRDTCLLYTSRCV